jgi:hypothetical protein
MREGDWICSMCNVLVFKDKTKCFKCGNSRALLIHNNTQKNEHNSFFEKEIEIIFADIAKEKKKIHEENMKNEEYRIA